MQEKAGVIKAIEIHCAPVFKDQFLCILKWSKTNRNVCSGLINVRTCVCLATNLEFQ